jgi:tetratricopeptide (TPR) repeat protein
MIASVPSLLHNLGYVSLHTGDPERASDLFRESLALYRDQGDQRGIAECLVGLAGVLAELKQPETAARLLGAAHALREEIGARIWLANQPDYERSLAIIRGQLEEGAFTAAWTAGETLPVEQAIAEATVGVDVRPTPETSASSAPSRRP